ncbi:MAG TPA: hypothetical protein PK402_03890 [Tepidisphaeraceae bacterium]|nr:hypothetical protein [Tepidisphaeraceae bacterium]
MKKFATVIVLVFAINFVGVLGGAGFLIGTKKINEEKFGEIKAILFPIVPPAATQPAEGIDPATTQPILRLDDLIKEQAGKPPADQMQTIREAFEAQTANLEKQRREIIDLRRQLELAQGKVESDRVALEAREQALAKREQSLNSSTEDKGFASALDVYNTLATKQVKDIFMGLDDAVVVRFLQSMEARRVAKVLKEFKTEEEMFRA